MYPVLCKMLNIRKAVSRTPLIVRIAVIGLLLAFLEQVVGYATNYWLIKVYFGGSSYDLYGLWKRCLCSSKCYCDTSESGMTISSVFETLGLVGLVAVIGLTLVGVFLETHNTIIKVSAAVTCFLTSAFIFAGAAGVFVIMKSDESMTFHFSFYISAKAGSVALICAFLLILDVRPGSRASGYSQSNGVAGDSSVNTRAPAPKTQGQRRTLADYLSERDVDVNFDSRRNREADHLGNRRQRTQQQRSHVDQREQYTNRRNEDDRFAYENNMVDEDEHSEDETVKNSTSPNQTNRYETDSDRSDKPLTKRNKIKRLADRHSDDDYYSSNPNKTDEHEIETSRKTLKEIDQSLKKYHRVVQHSRASPGDKQLGRPDESDQYSNQSKADENDHDYDQSSRKPKYPKWRHEDVEDVPYEDQRIDNYQYQRNRDNDPFTVRNYDNEPFTLRNYDNELNQTRPSHVIQPYSRRNQEDRYTSENSHSRYLPQSYDYGNQNLFVDLPVMPPPYSESEEQTNRQTVRNGRSDETTV